MYDDVMSSKSYEFYKNDIVKSWYQNPESVDISYVYAIENSVFPYIHNTELDHPFKEHFDISHSIVVELYNFIKNHKQPIFDNIKDYTNILKQKTHIVEDEDVQKIINYFYLVQVLDGNYFKPDNLKSITDIIHPNYKPRVYRLPTL